MNPRTPLSRVLGLGSAKGGTSHWWAQRVTAIALVPLGLWFLISLGLLVGAGRTDYISVIDWIGRPFNTVMLVLFLATVCYHSALGVQVVIEDYVHGGLKVASLILQKFAHVVAAVAGILAILRIAFSS